MNIPSTRVRRWGHILFGVAALLAMGCRAPLFAQPLPDRRDFVGRVVDDDDKPLADAVVTIRPPNDLGVGAFWGAQTVTDENGEFRVPDVEDGKYYVSVEMGGFAPLQGQLFELSRTTSRLDAKLVRLVSLKLRVLDESGAPAAPGPLAARLRGEDLKLPSLDRRARIGKNGELTLPNLAPGVYSLSFIAPGQGYGVLPNTDINRQTTQKTLEARLQRGGQVQFTARAADKTGADKTDNAGLGGAILAINALPDETTRAAGQLKPAEDVGLFLALNDRYALVTDESGRLELRDVPPGRYSARLFLPETSTPAAQEFEVKSGQESRLEFTFSAPAEAVNFKMELHDGQDKPLPATDWRLLLRPLAGKDGAPPRLPGGGDLPPALLMNGYLRRGQSDANGRSTLYPLAPGRWRMTLTLEPEEGEKRIPPVTQEVEIPAADATVFRFKGVKR